MQKRYLKTKRAADKIGCAASTLEKKRVYGGGPPYYRIGRSILYGEDELDDWVRSREFNSTSEYAA